MPTTAVRPQATTRRDSLVDRLASAHGHLGAIRRMAADGEPCPHLVYQLRAVRSALHQAEHVLVRQHLDHCLAEAGVTDASLREITALWDYAPNPHGWSASSAPDEGPS